MQSLDEQIDRFNAAIAVQQVEANRQLQEAQQQALEIERLKAVVERQRQIVEGMKVDG